MLTSLERLEWDIDSELTFLLEDLREVLRNPRASTHAITLIESEINASPPNSVARVTEDEAK